MKMKKDCVLLSCICVVLVFFFSKAVLLSSLALVSESVKLASMVLLAN